MLIRIDIEFKDDGTAVIRLPEGGMQQMDAARVAGFTENLAKKMGKITERHVGHHHGFVHGKSDDHVHQGE